MKLPHRVSILLLLLIPFSCNREQTLALRASLPSPSSNYDTAVRDLSPGQRRTACRIDAFFQRKHRAGVFNGTVLFAEKGKVVHKAAYGHADLRQRDTLTLATPFQLASVTKPITATALLMLVEEGKVSLNANLQEFFPNLPYEGITIEHLLTHRSGLPNYMYFSDELWPDREVPISNNDVLGLMKTHEPDIYYIPDYRYNYCNTNYMLLASVIEKASGMSYETFLEKRIFQPLGMKNSSVYNKCKDSTLVDEGAVGYVNRWRKAGNSYLNGVVGDKGVYSTVEDLFIFDRALQDNLLLSETTLENAYHPAHPDLYLHDNYGYGWRIDASSPKDRIIYHNGWWKGFRSYFIRQVDRNRTIIVLNNTTIGSFMNNERLLELMEGQEAGKLPS